MKNSVKIVRPIKVVLSPMETLLLYSGLTYIMQDEERNPIDRKGAERLKQRLITEIHEQAKFAEKDSLFRLYKQVEKGKKI